MAVLKYRDPATGNWITLRGCRGPVGPAGPAGPDGEDGYTYTAEEADRIWLRMDGGNSMLAPLDAGGHRISGTVDGTAATDAATVAQIPDPADASPIQVAAVEPVPRGIGDVWADTSGPVLEWDTAWKPLTLINGWTRHSTSYHEPGYRMLPGGAVELRGVIKHSTTTTTGDAASLPAGYRCASKQVSQQITFCNAGYALLQITSTAINVYRYVSGGTGGLVALDGITYFASA